MATKQVQLKKQAYASNLKSRALSVLIYLIDRSNQELTCFPAISTMAEQLHISASTVKRALRELVDGGYISKEARFREKNRGQSSNLYTLVLQQKKDGVRNNNDSDMREDVKPATDNFSDASEEQNQNISAVIPQGEVEHISFESLKRNREEPEEKETLRDCRSEKEETVLIRCLLKGFNIKQKNKKDCSVYTNVDRLHLGAFLNWVFQNLFSEATYLERRADE